MVFSVSFSKLHHGICYCINTEASASIRVSARNASLYIAVMIFCAQPYLKPCFMCPFYILSTCPSKGLCTALSMSKLTALFWILFFIVEHVYCPVLSAPVQQSTVLHVQDCLNRNQRLHSMAQHTQWMTVPSSKPIMLPGRA